MRIQAILVGHDPCCSLAFVNKLFEARARAIAFSLIGVAASKNLPAIHAASHSLGPGTACQTNTVFQTIADCSAHHAICSRLCERSEGRKILKGEYGLLTAIKGLAVGDSHVAR